MGRGIGFIDAHLLMSVIDQTGATLWTRDQRLKRIAEEKKYRVRRGSPIGGNQMPRARRTRTAEKSVEALRHEQDTRHQHPHGGVPVDGAGGSGNAPRAAYPAAQPRPGPPAGLAGKDEQDLDDLVVNVPPLYIQEKVHPKALIADLLRQSRENREAEEHQIDMFADFNGLPEGADRTEFYRHDGYWQNRMICAIACRSWPPSPSGRACRARCSASTSTRPYGIRFNSNFQWSTTSRDVRDATASTSPASRSRSRPSATPGATAFTPI